MDINHEEIFQFAKKQGIKLYEYQKKLIKTLAMNKTLYVMYPRQHDKVNTSILLKNYIKYKEKEVNENRKSRNDNL